MKMLRDPPRLVAGRWLIELTADFMRRDRPLTIYALAMLGLLFAASVASLVDARTLRDVNVWVKPIKFMAATAVFSLTIAWFMGLLPRPGEDASPGDGQGADFDLAVRSALHFLPGRAGRHIAPQHERCIPRAHVRVDGNRRGTAQLVPGSPGLGTHAFGQYAGDHPVPTRRDHRPPCDPFAGFLLQRHANGRTRSRRALFYRLYAILLSYLAVWSLMCWLAIAPAAKLSPSTCQAPIF